MRLASPRLRRACTTAARALGASLVAVASLAGRAPPALALDSGDARAEAARQLQNVRAELQHLLPGLVAQRRAARSTEKMIASGDLALRAKDYEQAIDIFNQVIELYRQGKATPNAHADGLFLLAQAYFESGQLLSARRHYAELLD